MRTETASETYATPIRDHVRDLFEQNAREHYRKHAPLADRMRPRSFDEFFGQEQLVAPGRFLRRMIESDRLKSLILWGPPGTGKTTLARIVAGASGRRFEAISAVTSGVRRPICSCGSTSPSMRKPGGLPALT